jgi:hypothetical protein
MLTKLTGRTIRRTVADDDEWAVGLAAHGALVPRRSRRRTLSGAE